MTRLLSLVAVLFLVTSTAAAWQPIAGSNPTWNGPVPYSLNEAGSADLGGFGPTETIVRQAFEEWTQQACTGVTLDYRGQTTQRPLSTMTPNETVGWYETTWIDSPAAIGTTRVVWDGNRIYDADMSLNGVNYVWVTGPGGPGGSVNAYSIILHEAGHYLGLDHSFAPGSAMAPGYSGGVLAIGTDDRAGICALYPGSGPTDCTVTGCPSGSSCVDGACVTDPPPDGTGTTCQACSSDAECLGRCLRYPTGFFCSQPCDTDADCGTDKCEPVSDGSRQCVRRDAAGTADCSSGPAPGPSPSPTPTPEPGALGATCEIHEDCDSGFCALTEESSFCTQACDGGCPDGFFCGDGDVCRLGEEPPGALGAPCTAHEQCASGMCAEAEDGSLFCTEACSGSCPTEYACVPTADGALDVCAPSQSTRASIPASHGLTGGCSAASGRDAGGLALVLPLVALLGRGRRRRR